MKNLKFSVIAILFVSIVLIIGCSDDDPVEEVSPLVGKYTITNATSTSVLTLKTNEIGDIPVAAGTNITQMIQEALLSAITCTPTKSIIELRKDNSIFMFCNGSESEINAGTWSEVSDTEIKLNLNSTAVPASPTGIALTIKNVVITDNKLTGEPMFLCQNQCLLE